MTSPLVEKLSDVRDFRKILETTVKEIGESYSAEVSQIILSNPLDSNFTSICEYLANPEETPDELPYTTFPLHLEGGGLGLLSVSRQSELAVQEINEIRLTLADIADILRYAQINDLVQRDTFRSAFMSEITNLMSLPMGLGDALFMVVNILGKALTVSRCIFVVVDDNKARWRSYEYWQRERVESAQDFGWPTKDSSIVSQTLLSAVPIITFEGQVNSYKTPIQEEMEFIGVRSQLSVAIRSSVAVHGAIILQQCESRHGWTRDEIDMVQSVADTVAEALSQIPEEKKDQESIMREHQYDVAATKQAAPGKKTQEVRKALKGVLGAAIPKAQKSKPPELAPPPQPATQAPSLPPTQNDFAPQYDEAAYAGQGGYNGQDQLQPAYDPAAYAGDGPQYANAEVFGVEQTYQGTGDQSAASMWGDQIPGAAGNQTAQASPSAEGPSELGGLADMLADHAQQIPAPPQQAAQPTPASAESGQGQGAGQGPFKGVLGGILGNQRQGGNTPAWNVETSTPQPPPPGTPMPLQEMAQAQQAGPQNLAPNQAMPASGADSGIPTPGSLAGGAGKPAGSRWGDLDSIPGPGSGAQQKPASKWGDLDSIPGPGRSSAPDNQQISQGGMAKAESKWGNLDEIPNPGAAAKPAGAWGDLDSIPAPAGSGSRAGLGSMMMGKAKAAAPATPGGLGAGFMKTKNPAPSNYVEGPPIQIDEAAAEAKLKQILASSNPTSDYIFATPGIDMRLLGRIDGWVTQVEQKDKYVNGHTRSVAEYSVAIARLLGMTQEEVNAIRLAAIVHDVGKLGLPQVILQKPDEQLSDAELVMMMNHTINGAKLIEGFPELAELAPVILSHHEEYNGEGYPTGAKDEEIPLPARIIQAANAYTELISDLVYRAGMQPQEAQNQMIRGAGTTYDPSVVEALIACISQGLVPAKIV